MEKMSKLLFITQKIDERDDDLAFVTQWVDEFIKNGFSVSVICLEKGKFDDRFPVYSLGKELGVGTVGRLAVFLKLLLTLKYDRVFVHMNPEYFTLGGWWWFLTKKPSYLWYTHYTTHIHLKLAAFLSKRMFAATKQSLPQYDESEKKVVTGHGIDVTYWSHQNSCQDEKRLLMVHRLSRSKRVEVGIKTLALLPIEYTLTIYGRTIDPEYFKELEILVNELGVEERVAFVGSVPMPELRSVYSQYKIMINMASETIDKTMLEAMSNGVFPVTTPANSIAIGLSNYPKGDDPKQVSDFILNLSLEDLEQQKLQNIVSEKHGLSRLIAKMGEYIKAGN